VSFERLKARLLGGAVAVLCLYLVLFVSIAISQRSYIYSPSVASAEQMLGEATRAKLEPWCAADGSVIGWHRPSKGANKLLVFHGSAGHAVHRSNYANGFTALDQGQRWEVWLHEYPGFGAKPGHPCRSEFDHSANQAAEQLLAMDSRPLFVLGESLGSGVACNLAAHLGDRLGGLILVVPYARMADVAASKFPFLPVRWCLLDRWDNIDALAPLKLRTAILIAGQDEVVGTAQGEKLFASIHAPKQRWIYPRATHNDPGIQSITPWAREVSDFLLDPGPANP